MKKIFLVLLVLFVVIGCKKSNTENIAKSEINKEVNKSDTTSVDISILFQEYLKQVHKINNPPENQTYIIIDLYGCPPCVAEYISEVEKIYNNKKIKSYPSLIVIGSNSNPYTDVFTKISNTQKNIYYDSLGYYSRINITPNESAIVLVKDGKIVKIKIINVDNYKEILSDI